MDDVITAEATTPGAEPSTKPATGADPNEDIAKDLRGLVDKYITETRKNKIVEWKRSVDLRMGGRPVRQGNGVTFEEDYQSEVNPDWSLTKTKTANLFSQVPKVTGTHRRKEVAQVMPLFMKALNYEIDAKRMNVAAAMEESVNDVTNAAGIAFVRVGFSARFRKSKVAAEEQIVLPNAPDRPLPTKDLPQDQLEQLANIGAVHLKDMQVMSDGRLYAKRRSPASLIIPDDFTGSDFDDADFLGESGSCSWSEGVIEFKLSKEDREKILSGERPDDSTLKNAEHKQGGKRVYYDEVFYKRYRYDPDEPSFDRIWRIVWIKGLDKPAVHEPWAEQEVNPQTGYLSGTKRYPIRVLTVTYISDNAIPPSDSQACRPQTNDMRRSRSFIFLQRARGLPLDWFDVNRVDPIFHAPLMRGTWKGMLPMNGSGDRAMGQISRSSYPNEDFAFDQQIKQDMMESWQIGPNQLGAMQGGRQAVGVADIQQQNFATRIGQERNKVAAFFLSICEVAATMMAFHGFFPCLSPEEQQALQQGWNFDQIPVDVSLTIRPDSTIVLDTNQRLERLYKYLNMTVNSGFVNPLPILQEITNLSDIDPTEVLKPRDPKTPDEINTSLRLTGKDDLMSPVVMAMLVELGQAPKPESFVEAYKILAKVQQQVPEAANADSGGDQSLALPPPRPGTGPAHPEWTGVSKIIQRDRDQE